MARKNRRLSRRRFLSSGSLGAAGMLAASGIPLSAGNSSRRGVVIDCHMHLEAYGTYWEGLIDEIIEHYDYAGVDKGVVFTIWTPSRESNDRTLMACKKYPDRFIPFGHVRTQDADWKEELERIGKLQWQGIKVHQGEISRGPDLLDKTRALVRKASDCGIRVILIHLADFDMVDNITEEFPEVTWLLAHMGPYKKSDEMKKFCELARNRANVFLDTSGADYYMFGQQFELAGTDKVVFGSDGFWFKPLIEKAKIEILQLPTPFRTPKLTDEQVDQVLGGNLARILQLQQ